MPRRRREDDPEVRRWRALERRRPPRIEPPGPGRESVWEYPRPPRVERVARRVRVEFAGLTIADSRRALRVVETASPPTYYLPPDDVLARHLEPSAGSTLCEWKGRARYWNVRVGERVARDAAWSYREPFEGFESIRDHWAFYAGRLDACWVGAWRVVPQPGAFYGGWITPDLAGPFKGEPGSEWW